MMLNFIVEYCIDDGELDNFALSALGNAPILAHELNNVGRFVGERLIPNHYQLAGVGVLNTVEGF